MKKIDQSTRDIAADVAKYAQNPDSAKGRTVTLDEMKAYVAVVSMDGVDAADKDQALAIFQDGGAKLDPDAQRFLYSELGLYPVNPVDPPIVALYAVAINTALEEARAAVAAGNQPNMAQLHAMREVAQQGLNDFGGASAHARPMSVSASVMANRPQVSGIQVMEVRGAFAQLDAFINAHG